MKPASASDPPDPDEPTGAAPARDERRARPPPTWLIALSVAAATLFAIPFVYLVVRNISPERELLSVVASRDTFSPLVGTLWLATSVSVAASAVGTVLAWLTMAHRSQVAPLLAGGLPASPRAALLHRGIRARRLRPGRPARGAARADRPARSPASDGLRGLVSGADCDLLSLRLPAGGCSPRGLSPSLEEASRLLGYRAWPTFWRVVWPQLRGAVRAGGLLVFLYVVSDFGVVWLMGYQTLTTKIFSARLADTSLAFALGLVLALVALAVVAGERLARGDRALSAPQPAVRPVVVHLGRWRPGGTPRPARVRRRRPRCSSSGTPLVGLPRVRGSGGRVWEHARPRRPGRADVAHRLGERRSGRGQRGGGPAGRFPDRASPHVALQPRSARSWLPGLRYLAWSLRCRWSSWR